MSDSLNTLSATVQRNCHIADARHAGNYTLCVYLLKMREYYRWERGAGFEAALPSTEVGQWVNERERLWESLEDTSYQALVIAGEPYDPFDAAAINTRLAPRGLVYSAGYGRQAQAHFFLGDLQRREAFQGFTILISGHEHARDLTAPPAMTLGETLFIRRESLRRMLWEKIEEWRWNRHNQAMSRALAFYPVETDLSAALEHMVDSEIETVILHEIGEIMAGAELGAAWHEMLAALPRSQTELVARAVRDHLADCLSTLPGLLHQGNPAPLHFYFANFRTTRKALFPSLLRAYQEWGDNGDPTALKRLLVQGRTHWRGIAHRLLSDFETTGTAEPVTAEGLIERCAL